LKQVSARGKKSNQPKATEILIINDNFKETSPQFIELIKLVGKYQQTVEALSAIGIELADLIKHIGQTNDSSLGEGLQSIGDTLSLIEINRKTKLTEVGVEMFNSEAGLDQRSKEMAILERDFKKKYTEGYREIKRLQQQKQKFHKGTTKGKAKGKAKAEEKLDKTSKALKDKIEEMDSNESTKLQEIILIDRTRYTALIGLLVKNMQAVSEHAETTLNSVKPHMAKWNELCGSEENIPERLQQLIASKPVISSSPPPSPREDRKDDKKDDKKKDDKKDDKKKKEKEEKERKEREEKEKKDKDKKKPKKDDAPTQKVQGLYQWVPRAADELAIEVGMEVTLIEEVNEEWWLCSNGERQGLIPSNYVKKL